jgi:ArsR family transcriptional regulator
MFRNVSNVKTMDSLAQVFKALAHPHRLAILHKLAACCRPGTVWQVSSSDVARVGWLGEGLGIAPSTVSHHLKELVRAGVIKTRRQGKNVLAWIDLEVLAGLAEYFLSLTGPGGPVKGSGHSSADMAPTPEGADLGRCCNDPQAKLSPSDLEKE